MRFLPLAGSLTSPPRHISVAGASSRLREKILFGNIAKLETGKAATAYRAARTQEKLPTAGVVFADSRRATPASSQPTAGISHSSAGASNGVLRRQVERHPLRHKVFHMEIPTPQQIIAGVGADMPQAGRRVDIQRIIIQKRYSPFSGWLTMILITCPSVLPLPA